mgnify:CR=1 FL=1
MDTNKIKSFSVFGLFETQNVHLVFQNKITILIGENGIGKTQVLNIFYYTLTKDFYRLADFKFDSIALTFSDKKSIKISKKKIVDYVEHTFEHPLVQELINEIGYKNFESLRSKFVRKENWEKSARQWIAIRKLRPSLLHKIITAFEIMDGKGQISLFSMFDTESEDNFNFIENCKKEIANEIGDLEILYFPTFRRVEEDLHNLGYKEDDLHLNQENTLIQFGMDDVQRRFLKIENTIETLLKEGLANFLNDVLKIVMTKNPTTDNSIFDRISENDLKIIFARAKNLDTEIKDAVLNSVRNRKFNDPLSGLILQKLVELYENQKELDHSVKVFRDVCNQYLIQKQVVYDESGIKIFVKSDLTDEKIELQNLSSGEKQIISIFSKVYLAEIQQKLIVLFDEPELSLSIKWQKNLLPDIIKSQKCDFILAVTHSPFIFDNELDQFAVGLQEYIKPISKAEQK